MKILNYDNSEFDIILLAGQSNAYGFGRGATDNPWKERDDVLMFKNDFEVCYKHPYENTTYIDIKAKEDGYIEKAKENSTDDGSDTVGCFVLTFAKHHIFLHQKLNCAKSQHHQCQNALLVYL